MMFLACIGGSACIKMYRMHARPLFEADTYICNREIVLLCYRVNFQWCRMSLKITPVKKQQAWSVHDWVICSSNKPCASKVMKRFAVLPLTCVALCMFVAVEKTQNIHRDVKLLWRGFERVWWRYTKTYVFSEALAITFPTAILQIDYSTVHIAFGWVTTSR